MSFAFQVRKATKDEAKQAVAAEMQKVVDSQPIHAKDAEAVLAVANLYIDLVADDDTRDVHVAVHGSISNSTSDYSTESPVLGAQVNVGVSLLDSASK